MHREPRCQRELGSLTTFARRWLANAAVEERECVKRPGPMVPDLFALERMRMDRGCGASCIAVVRSIREQRIRKPRKRDLRSCSCRWSLYLEARCSVDVAGTIEFGLNQVRRETRGRTDAVDLYWCPPLAPPCSHVLRVVQDDGPDASQRCCRSHAQVTREAGGNCIQSCGQPVATTVQLADHRRCRGMRGTCGRTRAKSWSGRRDLNPRPPVPQTGALPGCATPRPDFRC